MGNTGEILGWKNELTQERFQFVYGEELLRGSNGTTVWTYQTDRLGSVIGRLDASGTLAEELWYEEFGTRTAQNGTVTLGPTFGFTGYLYEEDTELYDARARYYDPELGGFLEEDPEPGRAEDALQRNHYGYCWNNPVRYRDPSGKNEIVVTIQEFLDWIGSQGGTGLTAVEETLVAVLGTAASAAAPYVAITVGVVILFVVLEDNRSVTVMRAPENPRNLLRELEESGKSFSQPFLRESITSKVLYDPQENKSSVGLDGSFINLIPETNISMSKKGTDTTKGKGQANSVAVGVAGNTITVGDKRYVCNTVAEEVVQFMSKSNHIYYPAMLYGGKVMVAPIAISRKEAIAIMMLNSRDVGIFAVSEKYARGLCSGLGGVTRRENHEGGDGYWYHYHGRSYPKAHCWFIG